MQYREIRYPRLLFQTCLLAAESLNPGRFSYLCLYVFICVHLWLIPPLRGSSRPDGRTNLTSHCVRVLGHRNPDVVRKAARIRSSMFVAHDSAWYAVPHAP